MTATAEYMQGTQRRYDPEETLRRIASAQARCGITRVLDVTRLDHIGIPTCNAVRPDGLILSVSNGKGWSKAAASVSAVMESIEVEHAEYPDTGTWTKARSARSLRAAGHRVIDAPDLVSRCLWPADTYGGMFYTDDLVLDWVAARDVIAGGDVLLPASTVYLKPPYMHYFTSNGLASGNTWQEATLHGLCEVIERDATARMMGRRPDDPPLRLYRIDARTMPDHLAEFAERIETSGIELFMFALPGAIDIYTFWSVFHCPGEPNHLLLSAAGFGSHPVPQIAASRAMTEAAQSRLTYIHGAREDLGVDHTNRQLSRSEEDTLRRQQAATFGKLRRIDALTWDEFLAVAPQRTRGLSIPETLAAVLGMLKQAGFGNAYVHDLTKPGFDLSVTRSFVPGLKVSPKMI